MTLSRTILGLVAALSLGGAALADDAQDGPMATAGASGAPPTSIAAPAPAVAPRAPVAASVTTAEQIDAFIRSSPAASPSADELTALDEGPSERRVHGSVEVGVGTHGYRHAGVEAHYPVGKTGRLSVAVGTTRGKGLVGGCPGGALGGPHGGGMTPFPGPQGCYTPW